MVLGKISSSSPGRLLAVVDFGHDGMGDCEAPARHRAADHPAVLFFDCYPDDAEGVNTGPATSWRASGGRRTACAEQLRPDLLCRDYGETGVEMPW